MKKLFHLIIIYIIVWLVPANIQAQDSGSLRLIYAQAESAYQIGRLDQALELLQDNFGNFRGNLRQSACRLMSLCYLAQDNVEQSEKYAMLLLKDNPYYSSVQDPIRFEEIIKRLRVGKIATITTASNQEESLDEAPVPVTLITEDMIQKCGARNLKELLITYVPGMSNVECNEEMNIAMRGVYSSGQEKILIMLNGHRLNSYCTNVARPDFAMSLDKVKQIEVLRGPASSLYGGVALTAVINIITKGGTDIDGLQVKGGIGNYGQLTGGAIFGKHYLDLDIMGWFNIYNTEGQKFFLSKDEVMGTSPVEGDVIIGGYNHRPTYDVGLTLNYKGFSIMHNTSFSKTVAPYTLSYFFSPYSYEKYGKIEGNLPGFVKNAHYSEVSYSLGLGDVSLKASFNFDNESQMMYQVAGDVLPEDFEYTVPLAGATVDLPISDGVFQNLRWDEENFGLRFQGSYAYQLSDSHNGSIVAGVQYDHFKLTSAQNVEGDNFNRVLVAYDSWKNLQEGSENSFNAFLQLKHKWNNFILNTGIRLDSKDRKDADDGKVTEWSPRLALLFLQPKWNLKLSYSKSFVDAPYFYRQNTLDTYYGGADLLSEYLHSLQFSFIGHNLVKNLDLELNAFHNRATNLVRREGMYYTNAGSMKNIGLELVAAYTKNRFSARLNTTLQRLIDSEYYMANDNHIYNIPSVTSNLVASYAIINGLNVYANVNFTSKQTTTFEVPDEFGLPIYSEINLPARAILNLGATYKINKLQLGFKTYNTLDKKYEQGGTSIGPIRQQGFWFMGEVSYKL